MEIVTLKIRFEYVYETAVKHEKTFKSLDLCGVICNYAKKNGRADMMISTF